MIIKIFGIFDFLSGFIFWLSLFNIPGQELLLVICFYLLGKGAIFLSSGDIASILDVTSAIIIFISFEFSLPFFAVGLVSLFLIQKGVLSLVS